MKIAIVGLGYVGLPLSLQFARSGVFVVGLDIDTAKVKLLTSGKSYIKHISNEAVADSIASGHFDASTDFGRIREVEGVIICVPTPLNKNREPDLSYILETGRAIAPHLQKGTLVSLESTTYPGTTEEELRAVLEAGSWIEDGSGQEGQSIGSSFSPNDYVLKEKLTNTYTECRQIQPASHPRQAVTQTVAVTGEAPGANGR